MPVAIAKMLGSRMMSVVRKPARSVSSRWARVRTSTRRSTVSAWPCSSNAMTTAAAPYRRHSRAWRRNSSSPSLRLIEFTTPRPWSCWSPASITENLELSTMTGTAAMSGSAPEPAQEPGHRGHAVEHRLVHVHVEQHRAVRDLVAGDRDRLVLAIVGAALGGRHQPRELARPGDVGPLADVDEQVAGQRDRQAARGRPGGSRRRAPAARAGRGPATAAAMAVVWSGVEPQHEPAMLSRPARAHSPSASAIWSGVSS